MTDKDNWLMERTEELSHSRYNRSYDSLPSSIQLEVFQRAEVDWINREADRIDQAYDAWLESQISSSNDGIDT